MGDFVLLIERDEPYKSCVWLPEGTEDDEELASTTVMTSICPDMSMSYENEQLSEIIFIIDRSG